LPENIQTQKAPLFAGDLMHVFQLSC
jgi:hypothetical protein